MSGSLEFHDMIVARLRADAGVNALVAGRVIDGPLPSGATPLPDKQFPCVTMGESSVIPDDEECVEGTREVVTVNCWTREGGKIWTVKQLSAAVRKALHDYDGTLATASLKSCRVILVRNVLDPDGITGRGIVQVEGLVEE